MPRRWCLCTLLVAAACGGPVDDGDGGAGSSEGTATAAETGDPSDPRDCVTANDCVPVGCECLCQGCGGFYYEAVVNQDHEAKWFEDHGCERPTLCDLACCEPAKLVCVQGLCAVE